MTAPDTSDTAWLDHFQACVDSDHDATEDDLLDDAELVAKGEKAPCRSRGPNGDCHRKRGHYDNTWDTRIHVSFDTGHYESWPLGWRTETERIAMINNADFGAGLQRSGDYAEGFAACLALVRATLTNPH